MTNDSAEPHAFRFSIAGMMLLTAVVAAHLAIGRWEISVMTAVAPLTLSITAIETLRRLFRVRFMGALVGGILLGAVLYSGTVGVFAFWRWWHRLHEPEMLTMYGRPTAGHVFYLAARNEFYAAMMWYLMVGMLVMLGYAAYVIVRDRRAARRIRLQAMERRAALPTRDQTAGDA